MFAPFQAVSAAMSLSNCVSYLICLFNFIQITASQTTKMKYFLLFFLAIVTSWMFRSYGYYFFVVANQSLTSFDECSLESDYKECVNKSSVFRVLFGSTLFHTVMFFLVYGVQSSTEPRAQIQNSFWIVKLPVYIAMQIIAFNVSQSSIIGFAKASLIGACVFILIQCVLIVDLGYSLNENWVARGLKATILMLAFSLYAVAIALIITSFVYFSGDGCTLNNWLISICLILIVVSTVLSTSERISKGILPPAVIAGYTSYLLFSALMDKDGECNRMKLASASNNWIIFASSFLTLASVAYTTSRTAESSTAFVYQPMSASISSSSSSSAEDGGEDGGVPSTVDDERYGVSYNYSFFHFIYILASMFIAVTIVNWEVSFNTGHSNGFDVMNSGAAALWVKVVSQWITLVFFIWSLVAPLIFPDRFASS